MENRNIEKSAGNNAEKSLGRGGRREGAGRPRGRNNYQSISLRIPADVAEILEGQEHRSAYIIEAIRAYDRAKRKRTLVSFELFSYTKDH